MSTTESCGCLGPAFDGDLAIARIERDCDTAGMSARCLLDQRRIAHRRRADDDARNAFAEPGVDCRAVADAAAELHRDIYRVENMLDRRGVHRLAGEGAVEIDDVEIFEPLPRERARLRRRVAIEHRRPRHVALLQAHGFAVLEVDRRKQNHGFHRRKFAISARPSFWLFSG